MIHEMEIITLCHRLMHDRQVYLHIFHTHMQTGWLRITTTTQLSHLHIATISSPKQRSGACTDNNHNKIALLHTRATLKEYTTKLLCAHAAAKWNEGKIFTNSPAASTKTHDSGTKLALAPCCAAHSGRPRCVVVFGGGATTLSLSHECARRRD